MHTEDSDTDWAREFLEKENEKPTELKRREPKKLAIGDRPDMLITILGAVLGAGIIGILWFLGINYGLFDTDWLSLAMAGAIVFGARFGINRAGSLLLVTSMTTYVIAILLTLTAIIYNQYPSVRENPFGFRRIETILIDGHFDSIDAFTPFAAGAFLILILTTVFGRRRY